MLAFAAAAAGAVAYVAANRRDAPTAGDADLLVERPAIVEEHDGYPISSRPLALAERASRPPGFATPPFRHIDDPLPDMLQWLQLARLLALRRSTRRARASGGPCDDGSVMLEPCFPLLFAAPPSG